MLINLAYKIIQICLDIQPFQSVINSSCHSPEICILFHQMNLESLVGEAQSTGHSGQTASDHQAPLVDGQIKFLQRLQTDSSGHRHPDYILCLFCGIFLLFRVDPGAMFSDISHVKEILINSPLPKRIPKQRLMRPGSTGSNNYTIEPFFPDRAGYCLGSISGTCKQAFFSVNNIIQGQGIFNQGRNIHHSSDISTAMARKDTYSDLFFRGISFSWIYPFSGQLSPPVIKEFTSKGISPAGGYNRLGDI